MPVAVRMLLCFLLLWQFLFHVSDAGMGVLILFLHHFFHMMASAHPGQYLHNICKVWPKSFLGALKIIHIGKVEFNEYIVCPSCHAIYDYDWCIVKRANGSRLPKPCKNVLFPNHPFASFRKECGAALLKTVKGKHHSTLVPMKKYCYSSIIESLKAFYSRPGFTERCQHSLKRASLPTGTMSDIYDGRVWAEFQTVEGKPFLPAPGQNLALSLNVDWFQPYDHVQDSVGALYLTILNLPCEERYRRENVLLCGIIPGPSEPKLHINSYLAPLVEELMHLWEGVMISVSTSALYPSCTALCQL